ncbi:MAG: hypothetical protein SGILL_010638 [Bacillariaceae sp.]
MNTQRKTISRTSSANAKWDNNKQKKIRLTNDTLRDSLHSHKDNLNKKSSHEQPKRVKKSSDDILKRKPSFLKDDPEVSSLLQLLQTTNFVGEIDPVHHSRYIAEPEEDEPKVLFDLTEMQQRSSSGSSTKMPTMTSYNSDEHLLSPLHASKRGLDLNA